MTDDAVHRLRAQLNGLTGHARVRPLFELSQVHIDRHWRAGPGSPAAEADLTSAIEALAEVYGYLDPGDGLRAQVSAQLGWLLGARIVVYGGSAEDRETAISRLEEGLVSTALAPAVRASARVSLGTLYLQRVTEALTTGDAMMRAVRAGAPPAAAEEATRAADVFRQAVEEPVSPEITAMAEAMLKTAEAMRNTLASFSGGLGGFDLSRMMAALTELQGLQQQAEAAKAATGGGLPRMPSLFDAETLTTLDPLDRPVALVEGPEPVETAVPRPRRPEAEPVAVDELRRQLREAIPGAADPSQSIVELLRPGAPQPDIGVIDELVALAISVTHQAGAAATAEDHLLLAVALHLRGRAAASTWADGESDDDTGDAEAATEHLLTAVERFTDGDLDLVPVLLALATTLDGPPLAGRLLDQIGDRFAEPAHTLRSAGVDALARGVTDGVLLLDASTARLRMVDAARPLPQRVLIVGEPLPDRDLTASYVSSARQALEAARRTPPGVASGPVFVIDPRGVRAPAANAAALLRRTFYPASVVLGPHGGGGAGTPDEVRGQIGASMLHLECGITATGALELAGPDELPPAAIAGQRGGPGGGLAVLPPAPAGFVPLADALLAAGFTGVVGWLRPVPHPVAALMLFVLHAELVRGGLPPARAVRAVRDWMRDKRRRTLDYLPETHAVTVGRRDLTDPRYWAALVHRGV